MSDDLKPLDLNEDEESRNPDGLPDFVEQSPFLRQFVFEKRFRLVLVGLLLGTIGVVLSFPKWWLVSPPGTLPSIKISGLDWVQSRMLW